jgi:hypothetical protein
MQLQVLKFTIAQTQVLSPASVGDHDSDKLEQENRRIISLDRINLVSIQGCRTFVYEFQPVITKSTTGAASSLLHVRMPS